MPCSALSARNRRTSRLFRIVATLLILACWSMAASAQVTLLAADFNDKPLGQPIGTGGAAVDEPASINSYLKAVVRDDVMPGKSLATTWANTAVSSALALTFRWIDEINIDHGSVTISLVVTLGATGSYQVILRESNGAARKFGGIRFTSVGSVWIDDATGDAPIGSLNWLPGVPYLIEWDHDLDAGTYDLSINGTRYFTDRPHGVTAGFGLGSLRVGMSQSAGQDAHIDVDDILVTWSGDVIFADGFEGDASPQ